VASCLPRPSAVCLRGQLSSNVRHHNRSRMRSPTVAVAVILAVVACTNRSSDTYVRVGGIECDAGAISTASKGAFGFGHDSYGPTYLRFPSNEVQLRFPTFALDVEGVRYDIDIEIWPSDDFDKTVLLESYRLRGRFEGARVVHDTRLDGFRVYDRFDASRWDLLSEAPSPTGPEPKSVRSIRIADCGQPAGLNHAVCVLYLSFEGHAVHFTLTDANMNLRDGIRDLVYDKLQSSCRRLAR
jgi:hypothetical protein